MQALKAVTEHRKIWLLFAAQNIQFVYNTNVGVHAYHKVLHKQSPMFLWYEKEELIKDDVRFKWIIESLFQQSVLHGQLISSS